tara:strand:- start:807 stop:1010 length:204 start_codon:yes stop_codon:yes gene_type:complete
MIKLLKLAIKVSPKLAWALSKKLYFNGKISFYNLDKIQNELWKSNSNLFTIDFFLNELNPKNKNLKQ